MALKERDTEEILELLDLVADGGGRHAKLLGAVGKTAMPRGGFERQQSLQRRQAWPVYARS
jgi:hypothetical protein